MQLSNLFIHQTRTNWPLLVIALFILNANAVFGQQVRGIVFEDTNKNQVMDSNEKGIPGVSVSNGVEVTQTDKDGKYNLPANDDQIIFVIKPSGYQFNLNEYQQPLFYYIHKPNGSPKTRYSGVAPTGPLPESVNFGLRPYNEGEKYSLVVFGDPQPYTLEEVHYFHQGIVSELIGNKEHSFGISLGDLVGDDLTLFYPYLHSISKIGLPWYHVYGNHDMNFDAKEDRYADETFEAVFGPANYSFNYGKVHYIVLDDVLYPDPRDGRGYWGGFRADQLEFVKNDLKHVPKDHLIVVSFHIPITEYGGGDQFRDKDREKLFDLLKSFPNTLSLSAHTHFQMHDFFGKERGWKRKKVHHHYNVGTTSGDWYSGTMDKYGTPNSRMRDGTPKGYAILNIDGNTYNFDYKVAGEDASIKMDIHTPKVVPGKGRSRGEVVVNFFQGSKRDSLFFRVNDEDWRPMRYAPSHDPAILKVQHNWDYQHMLPEGKRPSFPTNSTHIWRARIPNHFEPGEHTLEVKAKDFLGRTHTGKTTYIIR